VAAGNTGRRAVVRIGFGAGTGGGPLADIDAIVNAPLEPLVWVFTQR